MAKKKVEAKTEDPVVDEMTLQEGEMMIDDSFQDIPMREVPMPAATQTEEVPVRKPVIRKSGHTVNCLRNEKVTVRFVPSQSAMVH